MTLLFAEDDTEIIENYSDFLKIYFDTILIANDGIEALELYYNNHIDVMIVDIHMPKLDGINFIKKIRKNDLEPVIIILSAYDDKSYLFQAIKLNLLDYLIKPVSRIKFSETIKSAVEIANVKNKCINVINIEGGYIWDKKSSKLYFDKKVVSLTKKELEIFKNFCNEYKNMFTYEEVYRILYDDEEYNENKIKMVIKRLKNKLSKEIITNIYGYGYSFNIK